MKKIIVPIDFSVTSGFALRYACYIADVTGYDLEAVHVHDGYDGNAELVIKQGSARVRSRVRERVEKFVQENIDPTTFTGSTDNAGTLPLVKVRELVGKAIDTLTELSQQENTGLLIMGGVGSGKPGAATPMIGSVARSVAMKSACPVMLIPANAGVPSIKTAAIAFHDANSLVEISDKCDLLRRGLDLKMHLTHVEERDPLAKEIREEELMEKIRGGTFPSYDVTFDILLEGDVTNTLLEYILEEDIDLLIMGHRERSLLMRMLVGSHMYPIINECGIPLLVVPIAVY